MSSHFNFSDTHFIHITVLLFLARDLLALLIYFSNNYKIHIQVRPLKRPGDFDLRSGFHRYYYYCPHLHSVHRPSLSVDLNLPDLQPGLPAAARPADGSGRKEEDDDDFVVVCSSLFRWGFATRVWLWCVFLF